MIRPPPPAVIIQYSLTVASITLEKWSAILNQYAYILTSIEPAEIQSVDHLAFRIFTQAESWAHVAIYKHVYETHRA